MKYPPRPRACSAWLGMLGLEGKEENFLQMERSVQTVQCVCRGGKAVRDHSCSARYAALRALWKGLPIMPQRPAPCGLCFPTLGQVQIAEPLLLGLRHTPLLGIMALSLSQLLKSPNDMLPSL